jgi:hypothetical protein
MRSQLCRSLTALKGDRSLISIHSHIQLYNQDRLGKLSEQFLTLMTAAQHTIGEYFQIGVIVPDNLIIPLIWEDSTGVSIKLIDK